MEKTFTRILVTFVATACLLTIRCKTMPLEFNVERRNVTFTNSWLVEVEGGPIRAKHIAEEHGFTYIGPIYGNYYTFDHLDIPKRSKRSSDHTHPLKIHKMVTDARQLEEVHNELFSGTQCSTEEYEKHQKSEDFWYLHNDKANLDMMITEAWCTGRAGKGVSIAIVDDGVDYGNRYLKNNYVTEKDWDVNGNDDDALPETSFDSHGTNAAGLAAAERNCNCGIGIAPQANIFGVRLFGSNPVTAALEARSLTTSLDAADIYSCSWGRPRTGFNYKEVDPLVYGALKKGIMEGRNGHGAIYLFAAGNGASNFDSCAYDGFANSIYTMAISAVTKNGKKLATGEKCSAMFASVLGRSSEDEEKLVTTAPGETGCSRTFGESSAAPPLAAGIIALALEEADANGKILSWRDVQHIVARSANSNFTQDGWITNGADFKVNPAFGFGLMNAENMIHLARNWEPVSDQIKCETTGYNRTLPGSISFDFNTCNIEFVEQVHVQVFFRFAPSRGKAIVSLTSPQGTKSILLPGRKNDLWSKFLDVNVSSILFWGEGSAGSWALDVSNIDPNSPSSGTLFKTKVIIYGYRNTTDRNESMKQCALTPPIQTMSSTVFTYEDYDYFFVNRSVTWKEAIIACSDYGSAIVTPSDKIDNDWVYFTFKRIFWIGANNIEYFWNYVDENGYPIKYRAFPSSTAFDDWNKRCTVINGYNSWAKQDCLERKPFVCRRYNPVQVGTTVPPSTTISITVSQTTSTEGKYPVIKGNDIKKHCFLPIFWQGKLYLDCIPDEDGKFWCSSSSDGFGNRYYCDYDAITKTAWSTIQGHITTKSSRPTTDMSTTERISMNTTTSQEQTEVRNISQFPVTGEVTVKLNVSSHNATKETKSFPTQLTDKELFSKMLTSETTNYVVTEVPSKDRTPHLIPVRSIAQPFSVKSSTRQQIIP